MAFTDRHNLDHHPATLDLTRRYDRDPQVLIGDAVREHEPKLSDAVYGGIFFPQEQHVDPSALMRALHRRLVELGVRIVENAPLAGVRIVATGSPRSPPGRSASPRTRTCSPPAPGPARCPS